MNPNAEVAPAYVVFALRSQEAKHWRLLITLWDDEQLLASLAWLAYQADPDAAWVVHPWSAYLVSLLTSDPAFERMRAPFMLLGLRTGRWLLFVARPPVDPATIFAPEQIRDGILNDELRRVRAGGTSPVRPPWFRAVGRAQVDDRPAEG